MIYVYRCKAGHEIEFEHGMLEEPSVTCECGRVMWKCPQPVFVNWNGLRPSQGEIHPKVRELVETGPERREKYWEEKSGRKAETQDEAR